MTELDKRDVQTDPQLCTDVANGIARLGIGDGLSLLFTDRPITKRGAAILRCMGDAAQRRDENTRYVASAHRAIYEIFHPEHPNLHAASEHIERMQPKSSVESLA